MVLARLIGAVFVFAAGLSAQVPSPKEFFGHDIGEDYFLANYSQLVRYWRAVAERSQRVQLEEIGTTSYGQSMVMAVISSPANLAHAEKYRQTSERLCRARGLDDAAAADLAASGRAVVWIDGGLHASESVAGQNIIELVYRMASRDDDEVRRILDNVILLVCPANPDGMELIANAYMATHRVGGIPVLYQRYVGHDNNRDFYMSNQVETSAINRILYRRWYPQIVYNHHQTAPSGTVIFTPPFRDPINFNVDPRVARGIELVAAHMNARFAYENKPGVISRTGAPYSTWWNGGLRTTAYFHNMIGILTESFGSPNPTRIRQSLRRRLPSVDYPWPIESQEWHARQTIEYLQTANFAVLDVASRYRKELLYNFYQMGRDAIAAGSADHWTPTPRLLAEARVRNTGDGRGRMAANVGASRGSDDMPVPIDVFADPDWRDPRAYVLSSSQPDFGAATRFANCLIKAGVEVYRATSEFEVAGLRYPARSFVVFTAQAFRAQVMDMFEPQYHPDDLGTGGEPVQPYDSAGWTPALSMDVQVARVFDDFDGPFEEVVEPSTGPPGAVSPGTAGYVLSRTDSRGYLATNRLLALGEKVYWLQEAWRSGGVTHPVGSAFIAVGSQTAARVEQLAAESGIDFAGVDEAPAAALRLRAPRIGLFDTYGGNMATGWTQWVLEQAGFTVRRVYGEQLDAGVLADQFDVLVFHSGLPPPRGDRNRIRRALRRGARPSLSMDAAALEKLAAALPPFEDWSDLALRRTRPTADKSVPVLRTFVEQGGTVLAMGRQASSLIKYFDLSITEGAFSAGEDGEVRRARRSEFYIPASLVRADIDTGHPLAHGVSRHLAMMFRNSQVFSVDDDAAGIDVVARYATTDILASGWAIGAERIAGKAAVLAAALGSGTLYLYGADVIYRGQPQGSFKLVFNAILGSAATAEVVR